MIFIIDATNDICVGSFARDITLKHHVGFTKSAIESLISRIREEIELALILIWIVLCLCDYYGHEHPALVLALRVLVHVLPLDVVFMAHVDECAHLILLQ